MEDNNREVYTPGIDSHTQQGLEKLLNIIFIVDISGSMRGEGRIDAVNEAFMQMIPALRQIQIDSMSEFELKISIMTFEQEARWIVNPTSIMEYNHSVIDCGKWGTNFAYAFRRLGEKLNRKEFMAHAGKIAQPCIILITASAPTIDADYEKELSSLLENGWFYNSQRLLILAGNENEKQNTRYALSRFVTDEKTCIIDGIEEDTLLRVISNEANRRAWERMHSIPIHNHNDDIMVDVTEDISEFFAESAFVCHVNYKDDEFI